MRRLGIPLVGLALVAVLAAAAIGGEPRELDATAARALQEEAARISTCEEAERFTRRLAAEHPEAVSEAAREVLAQDWSGDSSCQVGVAVDVDVFDP